MKTSKRLSRRTIPTHLATTSTWPGVDIEVLPTDEKIRFSRLKTAIERYLQWEGLESIRKDCQFNAEQIQRALTRCCSMHDDGRIWGWRALIKNIRVKRLERNAPPVARDGRAGYVGALRYLLESYPEIQISFDMYLLTAKAPLSGAQEAKVTHSAAHEHFLFLCKEHAVPLTHWPYCVKQLGKSAIRNYVNEVLTAHYEQVVLKQYGEAAATKATTGTGKKSRFEVTFPYDAVEIDEHKAHFIGSVGIETPSGRQWVAISRIIIITVTDRRSAVVIGYHVTFKEEASVDDVLMAIHNALQPWEPRTFHLSGLSYRNGDGFPSGLDPSFAGLGWASMLLDGALIHVATEMVGRVRDLVGCDINLGPAKSPARRAVGERIFKLLCDHGFVRLPSTTGSNVADPARRQPEKQAVQMKLEAESIIDLVELAIASENAQSSSRVHGMRKLAYVEEILSDTTLRFLKPTLPTRPDHVADLKTIIYTANITGDERNGVRPRVYALGTYYTSTDWAGRWALIGTQVRLHLTDREDVTYLKAFTLDGAELGVVKCHEDWGDIPHSAATRALVNKLISAGSLERQTGESYMTAFLRSLKEQAEQDAKKQRARSRAATQLAEHRRNEEKTPKLPPVANEEDGQPNQNPPPEPSGAQDHLDLSDFVLPRGFRALNT